MITGVPGTATFSTTLIPIENRSVRHEVAAVNCWGLDEPQAHHRKAMLV
jgi:hypothetical protein